MVKKPVFKKSLFKTAYREVFRSPGRFFAIVGIIMLGAGFFVGLRVTKDAMIKTAQSYLDRSAFYDFAAISYAGYDRESVEYISSQENVAAAEGGISKDALICASGGQDIVITFISLPGKINLPDIVEGRAPVSDNECLIDNKLSFSLGERIVLSDSNTEGDLETFGSREFTVVGKTLSPLYMNFERGTSALGTGSVSAFIYIKESAFTSDIYTTVYIKTDAAGRAYTDGYSDSIKALEPQIRDIAQSAANSRRDRLLAEAKNKLDRGEVEYLSALSEFESQKKSALSELESAEDQLNEARETLERLRAGIDEEKKNLENNTSLSEGEIALKRAIIAAAQQRLEEGKREYSSGAAEFESRKAEALAKLSEAERELEKAKKEIDEGKNSLEDFPQAALYLLDRDHNTGYACFDNDTDIVKSVSTVFPVFFFLVAALICMSSMTRMVDEQRGQLGALSALGYSKSEIMSKYLLWAGSATTLGALSGVFIASYLFPKIIWQAYQILYSFSGGIEFYLDPKLMILTYAMYLVSMLAVTWLSLRTKLAVKPANLIRPKAPKAGKRVLIERIAFIWSRLGFMWKVTLRNIFRYKERVLMMVLGIGGCTALMIAGMGMQDSVQNIVADQYRSIDLYDYDIYFSEGLDRETMDSLSKSVLTYADSLLFYHRESVNVGSDRMQKSAFLIVIPDTKDLESFKSFETKGKKQPYPSDGEALINSGLANALGLDTGDDINIIGEDRVYNLTVSGTFDNHIYNYLYMNEATYGSLFGAAPGIGSAFVKKSGGENVTSKLLNEQNVIRVGSARSDAAMIDGILGNLDYIVMLTIVSAAALAFIVIYNLTNININERMREIATVKVLGFYPGETAIYVLRENILLSILGALLGIPLGYALTAYIVDAINVDLVYFSSRVNGSSILTALLLTTVFSLSVDLIMAVKLNKIDMAASLKAAE